MIEERDMYKGEVIDGFDPKDLVGSHIDSNGTLLEITGCWFAPSNLTPSGHDIPVPMRNVLGVELKYPETGELTTGYICRHCHMLRGLIGQIRNHLSRCEQRPETVEEPENTDPSRRRHLVVTEEMAGMTMEQIVAALRRAAGMEELLQREVTRRVTAEKELNAIRKAAAVVLGNRP